MNFLYRILPEMNMFKRVTRGTYSQSMISENREKFLTMKVDEKRKFYKCKENFIVLNKIKTWPEYYKENDIQEKQSIPIKKQIILLNITLYIKHFFKPHTNIFDFF